MNILFVGSVYSSQFRKILEKNGMASSSAGQTFEKALIYGLDSCTNVKLISEYFVPSYPKFKKIFIKSEQFSHTPKAKDESISFVNLPGVKKISQIISYLIKIRRWSKQADVVVVYEVTSRQLLSTILATRGKKKVVIVPDLPEFMSANKNIFYLIAKKLDRFIIDISLKHFDGFILFSPYMKDRLNIGEKPWMTLEGIYNPLDIKDVEPKSTDKKVILYTGKIEKWFGVEDLLKAFSMIHGNQYQLWLCGPGDIEMVNKYIVEDARIIYKGCVSHDEALVLQKKATILVNPRHSSDEFTMYSFPSKTMEYMASGTPTLMSRLKSLPDDYVAHLYLFDDESIEGMSVMIKNCLDKPQVELDLFGRIASEFIIKNKNSFEQAKRMVEYMKSL